MAKHVDWMIPFTYDLQLNHEDQKMPVLDLKVYPNQDGVIFNEFYEKKSPKQFCDFGIQH